jgi:tetratricopeptide (TPR) repeat protein
MIRAPIITQDPEMDRNFVLAHHRLGLVYEQEGKYDEAIAEFKQVLNLLAGKPLGIATLAHGYALSGNSRKRRSSG